MCYFGSSEMHFKRLVLVQEECCAGLVLTEGKILHSKKPEY